MNKNVFSKITLGFTLLLAGAVCLAQDFPNKPLRMIIPFAAGGGADIVGRVIAQEVSENIGQPVVVENRPGASGNIGATHVARSDPDGYTLLFTGPNHSTNLNLYSSLAYDPVKDFEPVSLLTVAPYILLANPNSSIHSLKDLITQAQAQPGKIAYGSAGNGTAGHLAMELLKDEAQFDILHIPYKGSGPMLSDLIGGRISVGYDNVLSAMPNIESGRLRAIATSGSRRSPSLPDVPTISESGLPGYDVKVWQGILVPAGTPKQVIDILNEKFVAALRAPKVAERLASMNIDMSGSSPEEFKTFLRQDIDKWAKVIKASGARVD